MASKKIRPANKRAKKAAPARTARAKAPVSARVAPAAPPARRAHPTEKDTFAPIKVRADRLWGAQTERSLRNFKISGERMPRDLVHALALVKKASILVNLE